MSGIELEGGNSKNKSWLLLIMKAQIMSIKGTPYRKIRDGQCGHVVIQRCTECSGRLEEEHFPQPWVCGGREPRRSSHC